MASQGFNGFGLCRDQVDRDALDYNTLLKVCVAESELLIPSVLVLLLSSLFCTIINAVINIFSQHFIAYFRSITIKRQHLLRVSQKSHIVYPRRDPKSVDDTTALLPSASLTGYNRAFFQDMESQRPQMGESAESPPSVVPSPIMEEALSDSSQEMRVYSQACLFPFHSLYMTLSTLKCLAVVLLVQYHFDTIPGGWMRFSICGAGNMLSTTCTPLLEYITNMILRPDNAQKPLASIPEEENKKDSVFIVEILVRIGQLELTDLTTVLIQGSTFVIFAAIFLPMFIVFCLPGLLTPYSVYLLVLLGLVALAWNAYYCWGEEIPSMTNVLGPRWASLVMAMAFAKTAALKVFFLFSLQVCIVFSFLMGMAVLDGLSYQQAFMFTRHHMLSLHLMGAQNPSRFQWLALSSQLLF
eukprot:gene8741-6147_t